MKRVIGAITLGVLGLALGVLTSVAKAEIPSTQTDFLDQTPVQITGFMWGSEVSPGNNKPFRVLRYIQIYNNSDKLINLSDWTIVVQPFSSTTGLPICEIKDCPHINLPDSSAGLLAPGRHSVIDDGETVSQAFSGLPLIETEEFVKSKMAVQFVLTSPGFQESILQIKPDFTPTQNNYYWQRGFSSTGSGYVGSFSVGSTSLDSLFNDKLYSAPAEAPLSIREIYPYSSDCAPNDTRVFCGDYIKVHVDKNVDASMFVVRTDSNSASRTSSNTFYLSDSMIKNGYITLTRDNNGRRIGLTNSGGHIWLEDIYGQKVYDSTMVNYPTAGNDKQGYSWAQVDSGNWQWSTTPSPDEPNIITAIPEKITVCPEGKYLNPETGRCRTLEEAVNALAACPEGQERNPATNRCRSKVSSASTLTPCGEGQERNPLTNRCRSIASAVAELLPCNEGYERNPATNRCRKITTASSSAGALAKKNSAPDQAAGAWDGWTWALVAVGATGAIGYGVYEWRDELRGAARKFVAKLGKK